MPASSGDASDADHSLSLIGYWKDPNNYWEARITQKSELMADQKGLTRNWFEVHVYAWIDGEPHEQLGYVQGRHHPHPGLLPELLPSHRLTYLAEPQRQK